MNKKGLIKKTGIVLLGMATVLTLGFSMNSCGKEKPTDSTSPSAQQSTSSSVVQQPTQDEKPVQIMVEADSVVEGVLGQKDFENVFNNALVSIVEKEYPDYAVQEVKLESVDIGQNGSFVLDATLEKDGEIFSSKKISYSGNTEDFADFFDYGMNKEDKINSVLNTIGLTSSSAIEEGSDEEKQIIDLFENDIQDFDEQTQLFKGITAEELVGEVIKTEPKEEDYISVETIVNEAFAGIDFNADLMETVETLFKKKSPAKEINKIYAFDFVIDDQEGYFEFYLVSSLPKINRIFIDSCSISNDTTKYYHYLNLVSNNKEEFLNDLLNENSLDMNAKIVKGTEEENNIRNILNDVVERYKNEKIELQSIEKKDINADVMFSPKQFTQEEMDELGIDNMNAFAQALLNNTRGDNFDQKYEWTIDDVVATYVRDLGVQNIYGESGFDILIITDRGIEEHKILLRRASNDEQNRYAMFLNDNPNTKYFGKDDDIKYSENVVLYHNRDEEKLLLENEEVDMMKYGYKCYEAVGCKDKPAVKFWTKW